MGNPTAKAFHMFGEVAVWSIFLNLSLIFTLLKHKKLAVILHGIVGFLQLCAAFSFMIIMLTPKGFHMTIEKHGYLIYIHSIAGLVLIAYIGLQVIVGIIMKLALISRYSTRAVLTLKKIHRLAGWVLAVVVKVQVVVIWISQPQYFGVMVGLII